MKTHLCWSHDDEDDLSIVCLSGKGWVRQYTEPKNIPGEQHFLRGEKPLITHAVLLGQVYLTHLYIPSALPEAIANLSS